jgi:Spy/CpxP family protein refolding chaperone
MRKLIASLMALVLVVLTVAVQAQPGQRRGGGFGGPGFGVGVTMLLNNASVQEELKLDGEQIEKARALGEQARERMMSSFQELQGLDGAERFAKMRDLREKMHAEAVKQAKGFLNPEQVKRLHEIYYQQAGANAFEDPQLQNELKLDDEQKTAIQAIIRESNQQMQYIFSQGQGNRETAMAKMAELRKKSLERIEEKLTPDQKSAYSNLLGSHFEIRFERPGGPGR